VILTLSLHASLATIGVGFPFECCAATMKSFTNMKLSRHADGRQQSPEPWLAVGTIRKIRDMNLR
jgi:hypothetical protein